MREISPALELSVAEFLEFADLNARQLVSEIRRQKMAGVRPLPSNTLLDRSSILTKHKRAKLLDAVALLVDENLFGRSEMCMQFAELLMLSLSYLGFSSRMVVGEAIYYSEQQAIVFRWAHAWVRVGSEVIDGNVDSLSENPTVPQAVRPVPYWGPIKQTPPGRKLRELQITSQIKSDDDVTKIWWPSLCRTIKQM